MSAVLHPSRWTLRTKLVAWMLLLFLVVTTAVGSLTVWQLNRTLMNQVDSQLQESVSGLSGPNSGNANGAGGSPPSVGESFQVTVVNSTQKVAVQAWQSNPGFRGTTTYVTYEANTLTRNGHPESEELTSAQVDTLNSAGVGSTPTTVDLGGSLGRFRVLATQRQMLVVTSISSTTGLPQRSEKAVTTMVGLPIGPNQTTVVKTAIAVALLSGAGVILVGLAATYIVRRNLEPLRRVADTATRVSKLPLSSGEVVMHERVEDRDTDERTEVGQVGSALNGMLDHIDSALTARHHSEQQVRHFVADASHELRTPLASIRGYAELSKREPDPVPEGVQHALGRIESEADRMTALVEDLLLLARLDAGRPLEREPVDLTMIALETVSDAQAAGPTHRWSLDLPDEALEVEGDDARIRQVLINLLGNARKHTPDGTHVVVSMCEDGDGVLLRVNDNGPGIDPDLVPRIFERFSRGDTARTRTQGSTGLGLSIVQAVITAHGGRVKVTSEPGDTTFAVWLPRVAPPTQPPEPGTEPTPAAAAAEAEHREVNA